MTFNGEPYDGPALDGPPSTLYTWGVLKIENGQATQNPTGVCREQHEAMRRVSEALRAAEEQNTTAAGMVCAIPINEMTRRVGNDYPPPRLVLSGMIDPDTDAIVWTRER